LGFGRPLFSQSRGVSIGPAASTTTFPSSVVSAPVRVLRQVTLRAAPSALTFTANASGISVAARPCVQRSAVSAIGT
jgi:hypothetical protein